MTASWLACSAPERPYDSGIQWHMACRACRIRFEVDRLHMKPAHADVMACLMEGPER